MTNDWFLVFTKLGSQLTAEKLSDLAIIPLIFIVQTFVSYICGYVVAKCFRFKKRRSNFVKAMAVSKWPIDTAFVIVLTKALYVH